MLAPMSALPAVTADLVVERIHAQRRLAVPGLVNGHTHAVMTLFRGAAEGDPATWFNDKIWVMESNLRPGDVALGTELAVAEMLLGGVTCFADMYLRMEEAAEVVERTGIRAQLAESFFSDAGPAAKHRSIELARTHDGRADGRLRTAIAPHAPYTCTAADLAEAADAARESAGSSPTARAS